ncbi:hypothetical protein F5Y14DRAFT_446306 [Nemania sp. NC0429]|nr:hypothetical protein F5Y14DRAFT_446306 [Nemania sp. NC0429]
MHFYIPLFLAAVGAVALPQGGPSVDSLDLRTEVPGNYSVGDIEWRGFEDFAEDQVFTGTIENVIQQMKQLKGAHYTPSFVTKAENQMLEDKHQYHTAGQKVQCGGDPADPSRIGQGIDYLSHLPDSSLCTNPASTCGRISCSWKSGIWWCNEKTMHSDVYKCSMFASYAARVVDECTIYDTNPRVSGKNSDDELNLSVVVARASC